MRFTIGLPTDRVDRVEEFVTGDAVTECARALEGMGFDACFVTDHPAPDAKWLANGGHHALDPFVALSFAAAATTRLRVQTHILVLAYRNPLLTAKSVLSLEALSGGRTILGVAAGYLKPEFAALGVDFDERNALTDEAIDVVRAVLTEDVFAYEGRRFRTRGTTMAPRLPAPPPIWIGGNSTAAIRRAVERGDGWVPFPNPASAARSVRTANLATIEDLAGRLQVLRDHAAAIGRADPLDVCTSPFTRRDPYDFGELREQVAALSELGVTWCVLGVPGADTRREYLQRAERLASEVVAGRGGAG